MTAVKLFIIRHAERVDHEDFEWQNFAHRAHDSPITEVGFGQAKAVSNDFLKKHKLNGKGNKVLFLVSPLNRCALTARTIIQELGLVDKTSMKFEQGVSEANLYLRGRMMGTHRTSNPKNALTDEKRSCQEPVLLGAGDLMAVSYPVKVDLKHEMIHEVKYNADCYEILNNNDPKEVLEYDDRIKVFIPKFKKWLAEEANKAPKENLTVFIVTHGALGSSITRQLMKAEDEIKFGYVTTVELEGNLETDQFDLKGTWRIPGDPRAPNAEIKLA